MDLTTLTNAWLQVKLARKDRTAGFTAVGSGLVTLYSKKAERYMDRTVTRATYTAYLDVEAGQQVFALKAYPLSSVSAIYNDGTRTWTNVSAISSSNYSREDDAGLVRFDQYPLQYGPGTLKVVYVGGMATGTPSFITAYPEVATSIDLQVAYHWSRRHHLGATGVDTPGGGVAWTGELNWLTSVKETLDGFKRWHFGG